MNQLLFNSDLIIVILAIAGVVVLALIVALVVQSRRVRDLQEIVRPKYGFLGKPIMAMAIFGGLLGAVLLTYNATLRPVDNVIVNADKNLVTVVNTRVVTKLQNESLIEFKTLPSVDEVEWGVSGDEFDIYWTVTGPVSFRQIELARSRELVSKFSKTLPKGRYEIVLEVFFADRRFEKKQILVVE